MDSPLAGAIFVLWVAAWCAVTVIRGVQLDLPVLWVPAAATLIVLGALAVIVGGAAIVGYLMLAGGL